MRYKISTYFRLLACLCLLHASCAVLAQKVTDPSKYDPDYDKKKAAVQGKKPVIPKKPDARGAAPNAFRSTLAAGAAVTNCVLPLDTSYIAVPRNDDGSFGPIQLPFGFELYDSTYNQVWINTNGNLTFTDAYYEYVAAGFPISMPMVAGFWADIDTRNLTGGQIYYKLTSSHLIVTWDRVGYYNQRVDRLNTFQIIIAALGDPLVGTASNVKFNYGDVQWATSGGFGGNPTTIGANSGLEERFVQIGRFNLDNTNYDGPGGATDGINYLDNQCFVFNVSTAINIPPSVSRLPSGNAVTVNVGDTVTLGPQFIGPEIGQTVTALVNTRGACKTTASVTSGLLASANVRFIADTCNVGDNVITFTATDDGFPLQATEIDFTIKVNRLNQTLTFPALPDITYGAALPALSARASSGLGVTYSVVSGPATVSWWGGLTVTGTGRVRIRAIQPGNQVYNPTQPIEREFCVAPAAPGELTGSAVACTDVAYPYSVPAVQDAEFTWSVSGGGTVTGTGNTATVTWTSTGNHTLTVSYAGNCGPAGPARTLTVNVTDVPLTGTIANMLPADGSTNVSLPLALSWLPVNGAVTYDLYIWPDTLPRPQTPRVSDLRQINYTVTSGLEYEKLYKWQVVAKKACFGLESPVQQFKLRYLPDLVVSALQIPANGFSGQSFSVNWTVRNAGQGNTTNQQWYDAVYLSKDAQLDPDADAYLGSRENPSALEPSRTYTQSASFALPQGIADTYYVIVVTNAFNNLVELNGTNNKTASSGTSAIRLTPPPDLQVTSIVRPGNAFSGQTIDLTWTVKNEGTGSTIATAWNDQLFLSKEATFNGAEAVLLRTTSRNAALAAGASYTQTQPVRLPEGITGTYYVYVRTDAYSQVFEHVFENNNTTRSEAINVTLTPPIDLAVTAITLPPQASPGETAAVTWTVENQGGSSTEGKAWEDRLYLSQSATFNAETATLLGRANRSAALEPGERYTGTQNITVPAKITGNYYLFVQTDAGNTLFEYTNENNNVGRSTAPLAVVAPDLVVASVAVLNGDQSGNEANVQWVVRNAGTGTLYNTRLTDRVVISTSATYSATAGTELAKVTYESGSLAAAGEIPKSALVKIPNGIAGTYYVHVVTDFANLAYEGAGENNNAKASAALRVTLAPWADLQVSNIRVGATTASAGDVVPLQFTVTNRGQAATRETGWLDGVYISKSSTWSRSTAIPVQGIARSGALAKDSAYQLSTAVGLPADIGGSNYYLYIVADSANVVYEHTDEDNNVQRSSVLYVERYPPVDLAVTAIAAPGSGASGKTIQAQWTVTNQGEAVTLPGFWFDAVYLSEDQQWDKRTDVFVTEWKQPGPLAAGRSYSSTQTFKLPEGVSGTYYLLLVTDHTDLNKDADRANNYKLIRNGGGSGEPVPIEVALTPPADLVVSSFTAPAEGQSGQPATVSWTTRNTGAGVTGAASWTEKIYLSKDFTIDADDPVIGTHTRTGALEGGASYTQRQAVNLPINASGNYILLLRTDFADAVYEHQAEANNTAHTTITVVKPPVSDLVVSAITVPATAEAGKSFTVQWKVKNNGLNPATGVMQEAVYLSADTVKDAGDVLLGSRALNVAIPARYEASHQLTGDLEGVSAKDYYVLVHTDILNNIVETNDTNNLSPSGQRLRVTVPDLPLGVPTAASLLNDKPLYYKLDVPGPLEGETVLVTLKGDTLNGANELYLRHGEVPSRVVYDYTHSEAYEGNQEITVPELKPGTYYLMAYGKTSAGTRQPVSLLAAIQPFGIRSVNASTGGNTGMVTIQVNGSKLGAVTAIRLAARGDTITAGNLSIVDPTRVYATFDLQDATLGAYDVVAENAKGEVTALSQGFTVVAGGPPNLLTNVVAPPNTRPSNVISLTVQFTNAGTTDLVNPVLQLSSMAGAPIGFTVTELEDKATQLALPLQELNGPAGILRPGATGTITVYAKATTSLSFSLLDPDFE